MIFLKVLINFCTIKQIQMKDFLITFYINSVIVTHILGTIPQKIKLARVDVGNMSKKGENMEGIITPSPFFLKVGGI